MRILLSGGYKTENILKGIAKKFESSGDEFLIIPFIDDINSIYSKGDYFDKALITEQSITRENAITDENDIRLRISEFAISCAQRKVKQSYVFLTKDKQLANMIYEEILPIEKSSAVLLKEPGYSVSFFHNIILTDVKQIKSEWVFVPEDIRSEAALPNDIEIEDPSIISDTDLENDSFSNIKDTSNTTLNIEFNQELTGSNTMVSDEVKIETGESFGFNNNFGDDIFGDDTNNSGSGLEDTNSNLGDNIFGDDTNSNFGDDTNNFGGDIFGDASNNNFGDDIFGDDTNNSGFNNNRFGEVLEDNTGFSNNTEVFGDNIGLESSLDENNTFNFGDNNFNSESTDSFIPDTAVDETLDMDNTTPITQSGELPNYLVDVTPDEPSVTMSLSSLQKTPEDEQQMNNDTLPGFDEPEETKSEIDNFYDTYVTSTNQSQFDNSMYNDTYQNDQINNVTGINGFNTTDYMPQIPEENQIPNNNPMGFEADDYDINNSNMQQDMNDQIGESMNPAMTAAGAIGAMTTLSDDLYNQSQNMNNQMQGQEQLMDQQMQGMNQQDMYQIPPQVAPTQPRGKKRFLGRNQSTPQQQPQQSMPASKVNANDIRERIKPFAARGNSIVVTGCGGCGTSTVAYNLANIIAQLGYTVLLVDMDTEGRTQSYISKGNYISMDPESSNLMSAINSSTGIGNYTTVVKSGFHLLTMGLATDSTPVNELIHKEKISRFINLAKTSYNFVVYDIPFTSAISYLAEMTYMSDNLVVVTDASNWGVTKTMLNMCNISSDEMQDTMFSRAQLVFNKYRRLYKLFGRKVKTCVDITKAMDQKVYELIGEDIGLRFEDMHIAGIINDDPEFEDGWYEEVQYSDTAKGQQIFLKLVADIVLKA